MRPTLSAALDMVQAMLGEKAAVEIKKYHFQTTQWKGELAIYLPILKKNCV